MNVASIVTFLLTHRAAVAAAAYLVYVIAAGNTLQLVPAIVGLLTALGVSNQIVATERMAKHIGR